MADTTSVNPRGLPLLDIGRDVNGRFRKNNPGGPGNPFARKVASLRKTLLDSVSEQELKEMIEVLKQKALDGDTSALKLILAYCVGKPAPVNDPDRMDIDEWDRLQQMSVPHEQYEKTMETMPACVACRMAQFGWPCSIQEGEGPVQHTIHSIHQELKATSQPISQRSRTRRAKRLSRRPSVPRPLRRRSRAIGSRQAHRGAKVTHRLSHRYQTGKTNRSNRRFWN